jgi:hypothetical protein
VLSGSRGTAQVGAQVIRCEAVESCAMNLQFQLRSDKELRRGGSATTDDQIHMDGKDERNKIQSRGDTGK